MSTDVEHTAEKERIIKSYEKSVDKEIYDFVIDVENDREDINDIARQSYVLSNYDVIEVVSDSSKNRNVVSTIYLKNADE